MPENINLLDISEMLKLLKGEYSVRRVKRSQFDHEPMNVPTEVSVVLVDYFVMVSMTTFLSTQPYPSIAIFD